MKIKKIINSVAKSASPKLRGPIIRSLYNFKFDDLDEFEFKLAESFEEKIGASKIVQESYLQVGLTREEAELRVSKYSLLPSTYVFIAKHKKTNQIVATISVIIKTSLGLPMEEFVRLDAYVEDGKRSAEFSALTVTKQYRSKSNGLSVVLMFYMMRYAHEMLGVHHAFICVREAVDYFYKDMFFFQPIAEATVYKSANNSKVTPLHFEYETALEKMKKAYNHKKPTKNVYQQLTNFPWKEQCDFSRNEHSLVSRFFFQQSEIDQLLHTKNLNPATLSYHQKNILEAIYFQDIFASTKPEKVEHISMRKSPRFLILMNAIAEHEDAAFYLEIQEVSSTGLMARTTQDVKVGTILRLNMKIKNESVELASRVVWVKDKLIGLHILDTKTTKLWTQMLRSFDSYLKHPNFDKKQSEDKRQA